MSGKTAPDVSHEREILSGQLQVNTCSLLIHTGYSVKHSDQLFEGCRLSKKVDFPRGNKSDFISLAETRSHRRKEGQVKPTSHQLASYTRLSPSLPLFSNKDSEAPKKLQVNSNIAFKCATGNWVEAAHSTTQVLSNLSLVTISQKYCLQHLQAWLAYFLHICLVFQTLNIIRDFSKCISHKGYIFERKGLKWPSGLFFHEHISFSN